MRIRTEDFIFEDKDFRGFAELLEETPEGSIAIVGRVVKGSIVDMDEDYAIVDVGLKSEGRVPLKEFSSGGKTPNLKIGDRVEVYVERMENRDGLIVLSHEKAKREASWVELERNFKLGKPVNGILFSRVKGGFTVDLNGAIAFLPGSQLDIRPIKDASPLMGIEQPFVILKMDRARGNIVVSRRAIMEESRSEARSELLSSMEEGKIIEGLVKNITDYGAFVDLGGVDGLLHVTDISWRRINHPSEVLKVGESVKVQVIRYNRDTQRVSLGMKQLATDPWEKVLEQYKVSEKLKGTVTNITDYGAFVELDSGVEGLVHISEMSWTKKNIHPSKLLSVGQEVEVMVLELDPAKRRIALGIKQCQKNPWETIAAEKNVGTIFEGEIRNITEFGLFIAVSDDLDGMVHMSDLSWTEPGDEAIKKYQKGQMLKVKVLEVDAEKERIALGVKQLESDPLAGINDIKRGDVITCEITAISEEGLEVKAGDFPGFIRKVDLGRDKADQRTDRFAVGEKIDAKVASIDKTARRLTLSIKARELQEEKEAMAQYGSTDSGASLGDILGAAFDKVKEKKTTLPSEADEKETKKKASTKKAKTESSDTPSEEVDKPKKKTASKTKKSEEKAAD